MKRRAFLETCAAAPAAAVAGPLPGGAGGPGDGVAVQRATLTREQWLTLAAVQDHLLPTEPANPEAPGAREVRATAYLDRALAVPGFDADSRAFLLKGMGWLNDLARERHRAAFHDLEPGPREDLLRELAGRPAGERWLSSLIGYTLEALLADPLYGGNPGGIGWIWLDHDPGRPRPTPANIFGHLGRAGLRQ
jgi:gluconate 2-dehydrogenase gamma chain